MMEADQEGFEKIHLLDKNKILDYFTGKVATVDDIDKTVIPQTLVMPGKIKDVYGDSKNLDQTRTERYTDKTLTSSSMPELASSSTEKSKGPSDKRDDKAKQKAEDEKGEYPTQKGLSGVDANLRIMEYILQNEKRINNSYYEMYGQGIIAANSKAEAQGNPMDPLLRPKFQFTPKIMSKNSLLQTPGKSYAKIYALWCEMIGKKESGQKFLKHVEDKGIKQLVNVKILSLKKKQKVSLLDEIIGVSSSSFDDPGNPIIIVPPVPVKGNLWLANALNLLLNGEYKDAMDADSKLSSDDQLKEKEEFTKEIAGKSVRFEIYNSVTTFSKSHWKRVVAIFVHGQDWQFKDWPKKESLSNIFLKIKGYYLTYPDIPVPQNIQKLNVDILNVNRNTRHEDHSLQKEIWDGLTTFMLKERYKG